MPGNLHWGTFLGNLIGIVSAILFAYVTNKKFVFASETTGMKELLVEFIKFVGGRVSTLIIGTWRCSACCNIVP